MKDLQRRPLSGFDARSVMLFAALTLGGTAALHAQQGAGPGFGPGGTTTPKAASTGQGQAPSSAQGSGATTPFSGYTPPAQQGKGAAGAVPAFGMGPGSPSTGPAQATPSGAQQARTAVDAAFERADTNRDGALNRDEAKMLPALAERFDAIDTDRNGTLSRDEVARGTRS